MTIYLDSLQPLLPDALRQQLDHALLPEVKAIVDAMLRLVAGAEAPTSGVLPGWEDLQPRASKIVDDLKRGEHTRSSQKRARDDDSHTSTSKRPRTDGTTARGDAPNADVEDKDDDRRVFSLHAISVSAPIRKKVNIDVHRASIRLTNPSSHKEECPPIPLSALRRAFLLPTRGKSKPHWTVVLLSSDVPVPPPGKGPANNKDAASAPAPAPQLVFGLDATLSSVLSTTTSPTDSPTTHTYNKGQPSLPALRTFLSHLPIPALEPSTSVFQSALGGSGSGAGAGVEAYRGAKEGTLWFLDGGVLWDGKPCEFFALEHLAPTSTAPGVGGDAPVVDGVRTISATGRTCSVILRRVPGAKDRGEGDKGEEDGDDDDDDDDGGVDVDFGMVDGREQEPIGRWIKKRRERFGRASSPSGADASGENENGQGKGKGKGKADAPAREDDPRAEDTEDEGDSDFTMDSEDESDESGSEDEDEDSDASADGEGGEDGDGEGDASDDGSGEGEEAEGEEDEDEVVELDPKHHPLLRPGAMPRMSRAAVEAVVGMVEQDMMTGGRREGSDDDEEDELDD